MRCMLWSVILCSAVGCAAQRRFAEQPQAMPVAFAPEASSAAKAPAAVKVSARAATAAGQATAQSNPSESDPLGNSLASTSQDEPDSPFHLVGHQSQAAQSIPDAGTLMIEGKQYRVQLVEQQSDATNMVVAASNIDFQSDAIQLPTPEPDSLTPQMLPFYDSTSPPIVDAVQLNLPTALSMIGGQHPVVGFAQWRVQEAYARLDQAKVLWLPSLQAGFSFHNHGGNYQASNGQIIDVDRNSFQYGLGAGATGAGTTTQPGLIAQFHLADAIFQPEIAQKQAWARGHAAKGVLNDQLLSVALAYMELLSAHQEARILQESLDRTVELTKLTTDFAEAGEGLQADADRMETERLMVESRLLIARERVDVASARLAQALNIGSENPITPLDPTVVPIELVSIETPSASLISTGLSNRPELKESQALVAAACEQFQRQKYAPFVPSILLGVSTSGFGGGLGGNLSNVDGRYDFDAMMTWQVRNLGLGESAARREATSRVQQVKFEKLRIMDQVAREISEAHAGVIHRAQRIEVAQRAIESAQNSYQRNLNRIRDGQGLPLEVLQSVQAMEAARREYLNAVTQYNEAQFQLQWALGFSVAK